MPDQNLLSFQKQQPKQSNNELQDIEAETTKDASM